jgi:hypothetical protein
LIDHGDLALARVQERARDAAMRGNLVIVGLWEIIGFTIAELGDHSLWQTVT